MKGFNLNLILEYWIICWWISELSNWQVASFYLLCIHWNSCTKPFGKSVLILHLILSGHFIALKTQDTEHDWNVCMDLWIGWNARFDEKKENVAIFPRIKSLVLNSVLSHRNMNMRYSAQRTPLPFRCITLRFSFQSFCNLNLFLLI